MYHISVQQIKNCQSVFFCKQCKIIVFLNAIYFIFYFLKFELRHFLKNLLILLCIYRFADYQSWYPSTYISDFESNLQCPLRRLCYRSHSRYGALAPTSARIFKTPDRINCMSYERRRTSPESEGSRRTREIVCRKIATSAHYAIPSTCNHPFQTKTRRSEITRKIFNQIFHNVFCYILLNADINNQWENWRCCSAIDFSQPVYSIFFRRCIFKGQVHLSVRNYKLNFTTRRGVFCRWISCNFLMCYKRMFFILLTHFFTFYWADVSDKILDQYNIETLRNIEFTIYVLWSPVCYWNIHPNTAERIETISSKHFMNILIF